MNSSAVSVVVFEVPLIVFPIGKQDFYLPVKNFESIKAAFYYLIRQRKKDTIALGLSVTPLPLEDGTCFPKFAQTSAVTQVRLPLPLVDITVWENYLTQPLSDTFGYLSIIYIISDRCQLVN